MKLSLPADRASLAPFVILLGPNAALLALAVWTANIRDYLVNFDYLAVVLLLAAFGRRRRSWPAFVLATVLMTICLGLDLFTSYQRIYFAGPIVLLDYLPFIATWPWSVVLPQLVGLFLLALVLVWFGRPARDGGIRIRPVLIFSGLLILIDIGLSLLGPRLMATPSVNIASSGFKLVLQPSFNHLKNQLLARPIESVPFGSPTFYAQMMARPTLPPRILSVAVESLGLERDPALRARLLANLVEAVSPSYRLIEEGAHLSIGATLAGEARELCGIRLDGVPFWDRDLAVFQNCLPARLARRGYETTAWHGSDSSFYNRSLIYPRMGFNQTRFFGDMSGEVLQLCTYLFVGICDRDTFRMALRSFGNAPREFVHVMSLDTHLPINNPQIPCEGAPDRQLCLLRLMLVDTLRSLGEAIRNAPTKPDLIVVYGDHPPPLTDGRVRALLDERNVPYWVLERVPREGAAGQVR